MSAVQRPPPQAGALLLTGATGFLGMELLCRYLERSERHVYALVRARDEEQAAERLRAAIERVCGDCERFAGRWTAVPGDICEPGLGVDAETRRRLGEEVDEIL